MKYLWIVMVIYSESAPYLGSSLNLVLFIWQLQTFATIEVLQYTVSFLLSAKYVWSESRETQLLVVVVCLSGDDVHKLYYSFQIWLKSINVRKSDT